MDVRDEAGGAPVLVSVKEKEKRGYEQPEGKRNPELQRRANRHREQIFSVVQPHTERTLGRAVEMTGIDALYPFWSVEVTYRTVDEPVVAGTEFVALRDDGSVRSAMSIGDSVTVVPAETVSGLYPMAHRAEVAAMREYLATAFPEYTGLPRGYMDTVGASDPVLRFAYFSYDHEEDLRLIAAEERVYEAYHVDRDRTDEEWRQVVDDAGYGGGLMLGVDLVHRDPAVEITEAMARSVADQIRSHPLFESFATFSIDVRSGSMLRDAPTFHDTWSFTARPEDDGWWRVQRTRDGATIR